MMISTRRIPAILLLSLPGILSACGGSGDDAGAPAEQSTEQPATSEQAVEVQRPSLEDIAPLGVRNAREPRPGLITAGQITTEQFEALEDAGFTHFISLRLPDENGAGWEEAFVEGRDVAFHRIPVAGAAGLTREAVEELDRTLAEAGDEPTVLYCGSSNRVGALMALRAYWLKGATPEEAMEIGRAAGMTRLEPAVARMLGIEGS